MWAGLSRAADRLQADCGARLPSVDSLAVMHLHVKSAIIICLQFISNMFTIDTCIQRGGSAPVYLPTVYPKKYAHGFCFAVLCCGYTLTDFPISIRLTSLALGQSNDCPSANKATLMNMDKSSYEFIMNDCITTTKQSTTKPCAYFLGYTVHAALSSGIYVNWIDFNHVMDE